jgi:RsiW-degrading membrane proteinase PrsW (M82 family)
LIVVAVVPGWMSTLQAVSAKVSGLTDLDKIMQVLAPYLMNPFVMILLFLVFSVITPMIEEAIKPLLVWITAKRLASPAQGFALGALSGAGFALVESLLASSTPSEGWGLLLAARAGGGLMHIVASGLMGWAIVSAFQQKGKRLRLLGIYLLCLVIHGTWNAAAVIIEFGSIQAYLNTGAALPFSAIGVGILVLMVPVILTVLLVVNHKLRPHPVEVPAAVLPPAA